MKQRPLTVEFRLRPTKTSPKPPAGFKAERQRRERAARKARNLALAYYIDELVRSGQVTDLASVARMCAVSRARVSRTVGTLSLPTGMQSSILYLFRSSRRPPTSEG